MNNGTEVVDVIEFINNLDPAFQQQLLESIKSILTDGLEGIKVFVAAVVAALGGTGVYGIFTKSALRKQLKKEIASGQVDKNTLKAVVNEFYGGVDAFQKDILKAFEAVINKSDKMENMVLQQNKIIGLLFAASPAPNDVLLAGADAVKALAEASGEFGDEFQKIIDARVAANKTNGDELNTKE